MSKNTIALFATILYCFLFTTSSNAQFLKSEATEDENNQATEQYIDPMGRSNPKGTVYGFFKSLGNEDFKRAAEFLNLSSLESVGADSLSTKLVVRFEKALNKEGNILPINLINNTPQGDIEDGLDTNLEEVGTLTFKGQSDPIILERLALPNGEFIWQVSSATLHKYIEEIIETKGSEIEVAHGKNWFSHRWNGAPIKHWLFNILLAIGAYGLAWLFTLALAGLFRKIWPNFKQNRLSNILKTLLIPLRLVLAVGILLNVSRFLGISIVVRQAFGVVNLIAMWTALFLFIWLLINTSSSIGEERMRENNRFGGLSALSFFKNTAKFILIVVALLIAFDTLGVNVTAGIAALGVGGIALALGAQKTIENIIGGLSVVFDQPVSVGDFCQFGDTVGTVEKIGMRSTRIRTPNRTVVTVPNADFSSRLIENFSKRDMILFDTKIGLRYETTSHQMRYVLIELRKILYAHPKVNPDSARVRFLEYGTDSLIVEIRAYIITSDYNEFLGIKEDLNFRIASVVEDSGTSFAFPSQTLYLAKDEGLSKEKQDTIRDTVDQWKKNNELHLPEFDQNTIDSLKGTIQYPDKGSSSS